MGLSRFALKTLPQFEGGYFLEALCVTRQFDPRQENNKESQILRVEPMELHSYLKAFGLVGNASSYLIFIPWWLFHETVHLKAQRFQKAVMHVVHHRNVFLACAFTCLMENIPWFHIRLRFLCFTVAITFPKRQLLLFLAFKLPPGAILLIRRFRQSGMTAIVFVFVFFRATFCIWFRRPTFAADMRYLFDSERLKGKSTMPMYISYVAIFFFWCFSGLQFSGQQRFNLSCVTKKSQLAQ